MIRGIGYMPASLGDDSVDLAALGLTSGPIDESTGKLWSDEGYEVDGDGNLILDANGNPIMAFPVNTSFPTGTLTPTPGGTSTPAVAPGTISSPPAAPAAWSPTGAKLLYTAQITAGFGDLTLNLNSIIAQLGQAISSYGLQVTNSSSSGGLGWSTGFGSGQITLNITDTTGHASQSDLIGSGGIIDNALRNIIGSNNLSSSNISVTSTPGTGGSGGSGSGAPGTNLSTWFENNAGTVAVVAIALVAIPSVFGGSGRRR